MLAETQVIFLGLFVGKKADQNSIKVVLIPQTFLIFVQNLSERMSFLEPSSELQCRRGVLLINYVIILEEWSLTLASLTLHVPHCVHTSMTLRKMKFISKLTFEAIFICQNDIIMPLTGK